MLLGLFTDGTIALYSFMSGGLFCLLCGQIFSLSIAGLGSIPLKVSLLNNDDFGRCYYTTYQGKLADIFTIHSSYWITVVCFYLMFFALKVKKF